MFCVSPSSHGEPVHATDVHTNIVTDGQTDRQTETQTDRDTDRQTYTHTVTDRQSHNCVNTSMHLYSSVTRVYNMEKHINILLQVKNLIVAWAGNKNCRDTTDLMYRYTTLLPETLSLTIHLLIRNHPSDASSQGGE